MNFKKLATLILLTVLVIGFSKNSVLAAAEETTPASSVATEEAVTSDNDVQNTKKTTTTTKSSTKKKTYTKAELRLMASIINCEAGGESYQGKLAVGIVIMNRIKSKDFPNTLRGVIYQKGQFSPVRNGALKKRLAQYDAGKINNKQWKDCIRAAKSVLEGQSYITVNGNKKSLKGYYFFSVYLSGARFRLGGHRFK